jgi:hypothetical protein
MHASLLEVTRRHGEERLEAEEHKRGEAGAQLGEAGGECEARGPAAYDVGVAPRD